MTAITNQQNIDAWSAFGAEQIAAFGDEGDASRRYILNPVLFELLGDVRGKQILDAGCGTGYLCRMLARRGAQVTGVEPATTMFNYAVGRENADPHGITYLQQDLSELSGYSNNFDIVVSNMVLMDIPDYQRAMHNCIAANKSGGQFIFSLLHPCFDEVDRPGLQPGYDPKGYIRVEEYFEEFVIKQMYGIAIHRPLSAYVNFLIHNGCVLRKMIEPTLSPEGLQALGPNNRNMHVPNFIVISASKF